MKSVFVVIICLVAVHLVTVSGAGIWQQELGCDPNGTCRPGAMEVDVIHKEVIVLGTTERADTKEADCRLWKVDTNGTVINSKSCGLLPKYGARMARLFGIEASVVPNTGDIVRLQLDDANSMSLSVAKRDMQSCAVKLNIPVRKLPGELMLHDMISYHKDTLILAGQDGTNGIVMRVDMEGHIIWEKIFDRGQTDILWNFTCDSDGNNFYVVGISLSLAGKMTLAGPATVCVLCYDGNGELKASDFFEGGYSPWPSSLPKVISLSSGEILVVYDKSKDAKTTDLYAKAYTKGLTPLWEKQVLQTRANSPPAVFDICATAGGRFVLAIKVNIRDLRVCEYNADGTILQALDFDREVGPGGVYVAYLDGKIFVVSTARVQENEKEARIKLLALKSYSTN